MNKDQPGRPRSARHPSDEEAGEDALAWAVESRATAWVGRETERRVRRRRIAAFAGGIGAALIAGFALHLVPQGVEPAGQFAVARVRSLPASDSAPMERVLTDGSIVRLKAGAQIDVHFSDAFRRVSLLRGQAYFQVAKNPRRPFIVSAGGFEINAWIEMEPGNVG